MPFLSDAPTARDGISVAVRIGFDDNRSLGARDTGALAALLAFREIIPKAYSLPGKVSRSRAAIPCGDEANIDAYLREEAQ